MKQALSVLAVSLSLLSAIGCATNFAFYPAGEVQPIGPLPQVQVDSPEYTASVATLWNAIDAILTYTETDMRPIFNGLHRAGEKMDHDALDVVVADGIRKSDKWFLLLLEGEGALKHFRTVNAAAHDPQLMRKGERVILSAQAFLKQSRLWISQGRRIFEDGYAYNRSWHEKILTHLNDNNEASYNAIAKQFHEQERMVRESRDALAQALHDLLA